VLLEGLRWSVCFRGEGCECSRAGWSTCKGRGKEVSGFVVERSQICRRWRRKRKENAGECGGGEAGLLYLEKKNGPRNLFEFFLPFVSLHAA